MISGGWGGSIRKSQWWCVNKPFRGKTELWYERNEGTVIAYNGCWTSCWGEAAKRGFSGCRFVKLEIIVVLDRESSWGRIEIGHSWSQGCHAWCCTWCFAECWSPILGLDGNVNNWGRHCGGWGSLEVGDVLLLHSLLYETKEGDILKLYRKSGSSWFM